MADTNNILPRFITGELSKDEDSRKAGDVVDYSIPCGHWADVLQDLEHGHTIFAFAVQAARVNFSGKYRPLLMKEKATKEEIQTAAKTWTAPKVNLRGEIDVDRVEEQIAALTAKLHLVKSRQGSTGKAAKG